MVDIEMLKQVIADSGMTMVAIADKSNMVKATLYNRLAGVGDFTATEIVALSKTLHLSNKQRDDIFLTEKMN